MGTANIRRFYCFLAWRIICHLPAAHSILGLWGIIFNDEWLCYFGWTHYPQWLVSYLDVPWCSFNDYIWLLGVVNWDYGLAVEINVKLSDTALHRVIRTVLLHALSKPVIDHLLLWLGRDIPISLLQKCTFIKRGRNSYACLLTTNNLESMLRVGIWVWQYMICSLFLKCTAKGSSELWLRASCTIQLSGLASFQMKKRVLLRRLCKKTSFSHFFEAGRNWRTLSALNIRDRLPRIIFTLKNYLMVFLLGVL